DDMLGHRVEGELTKKLKACVLEFPEVYGVYDIILHNYGPDIYLGSLHIEIDDTMTADKLDALTRDINTKAFNETGIILTAVGIYSRNTRDDELMEIRSKITKLVVDHDHVIQMHGFYIDEAKKRISLDVVIDFAEEDREGLFNHILEDVQKAVPGYEIKMALDSNISD
ncbi:MAG: cation transporter, partial [Clostridiales bacterium]|nr:cation transporter [Clostridiales bacterium]